MTLDFALFNYFPYGGLQRDFLKTAIECQKLGHDINVYTSQWQGACPDGFTINRLPIQGSSNHRRMESFQQQLVQATGSRSNLLIGFNKLAGLDIYFASDTCYREKAMAERSLIYRWTPRYKAYEKLEQAVFAAKASTLILTLTQQQITDFQRHYQTPPERFKLLPPGISRNTLLENRATIREELGKKLNIPATDLVLLLVGSSFKTKGLDRAIKALAALPEKRQQTVKLLVAGGDKQDRFIALTRKLGLSDNTIHFLGARDDIQQLMLAADLLIHPAYTESAGMVLVEALAAGLPVLTTENCGYAFHITAADAGVVLPSPFQQPALNRHLNEIISSSQHRMQWHNNAKTYAAKTDLYSLHQQAAKIIDQQAQTLLNQ